MSFACRCLEVGQGSAQVKADTSGETSERELLSSSSAQACAAGPSGAAGATPIRIGGVPLGGFRSGMGGEEVKGFVPGLTGFWEVEVELVFVRQFGLVCGGPEQLSDGNPCVF